jgi:hypothetical protein
LELKDFTRFAASLAEREGAEVDRAIRDIHTTNAASGSLKSGGTIKQSAKVGRDVAIRLSIALLNDFERAKLNATDEPLFDMARRTALGFVDGLWARWLTDKAGLQPGGSEKAARQLLEEIRSDVIDLFDRHWSGLEVEGVTRLGPPEIGPNTRYRQAARPPTYPEAQGAISVDYRSHNGDIDIGRGDWRFETTWSTAGNGAIHTYSDRGVRIAVAPGVQTLDRVTRHVFEQADFTSRSRRPRAGEVVLLENSAGYAAAIEIEEVRVTPESAFGTVLNARYRILTDRSRDFSGSAESTAQISEAAAEALKALSKVEPFDEGEPSPAGVGHNRPPPDAALNREDYDRLSVILRDLRDSRSAPEPTVIQSALDVLSDVKPKIAEWLELRARLIREGFYRELGATAAKIALFGLAAWAVVDGWLEPVLDLLRRASGL